MQVRRVTSLRPELSSAAVARRLVREVLGEVGRENHLDAAELACAEVVGNAILHAHTEIEVTVEADSDADSVRVAVRDQSPLLPVRRDYTEQATTGRGMALVAALTSEHGISDAGPDGKTVWFVIDGRAAEQSEADLIAAWDDVEDWDVLEDAGNRSAGAAAELFAAPSTKVVELNSLPPALWLAAREHHDALIRELILYLAEHSDVEVDVAATDRARATISSAVVSALRVDRADDDEGPARDGDPTSPDRVPGPLDIRLSLVDADAAAFLAMQDTLDAAERLAVSDRLLVQPGLPEIIAIRDWACSQVAAQLAGFPPAPWPGTAQRKFETQSNARAHQADPASGYADELADRIVAIAESAGGQIAVDQANRVVAVSGPLADHLGWAPTDLVGRRVVALIPTRLREAHVAGFSRHLVTGETHVIGQSLELPVLRADGSEVVCRVQIERTSDRSGALFVAEITPA